MNQITKIREVCSKLFTSPRDEILYKRLIGSGQLRELLKIVDDELASVTNKSSMSSETPEISSERQTYLLELSSLLTCYLGYSNITDDD